MDSAKLKKGAQPQSLGGYLKKSAAKGHTHGGHLASIRTAVHNGHTIELTTSYLVKVDGRAVEMTLMVDDMGTVHCHAVPNYQFSSAMDMVKTVIDTFPDEFGGKPDASPTRSHGRRSAPKAITGRATSRRKSS